MTVSDQARSPFAGRLANLPPVPKGDDVVIRDLSDQPRIGFKGKGTTNWLGTQLGTLPGVPNKAIAVGTAACVARLGAEEYLVLSNLSDPGNPCERLETTWWGGDRSEVGYPLPRSDSHSWLQLEGPFVPSMMAKICGVDLRAASFAEWDVAQTVVARISATIIRVDVGDRYGLHLLTDFASADYIFDVLQDASAEFFGGFHVSGARSL